jgi:two-component system, OmpR family, sensor histidine kinase KdpD
MSRVVKSSWHGLRCGQLRSGALTRSRSAGTGSLANAEAAGFLLVAGGAALATRTLLPDPGLALLAAVLLTGIRHGSRVAVRSAATAVILVGALHLTAGAGLESPSSRQATALGCFAFTALLGGALVGRLRDRLNASRVIADRNERLYDASRLLAAAPNADHTIQIVRELVADSFGQEALLFVCRDGETLQAVHTIETDAECRAAALAACDGPPMPPSRASLEKGAWCFVPLRGELGRIGALGIRCAQNALTLEQGRFLFAIGHLAAVALDRHRLADEMRTAQVLTETERLRAALLSSVSHDLRTPLAAIIGSASTLDELGELLPPSQQRDLLGTILGEAERLNRFVGNLLDMTRIEYGGLEPRPAWCDVRDVVADAARGLHAVLEKRELQLDVSADFPLLYVDGVLLERVLENLIDNAAKYGGPDAPLQVSAHCAGERAVLRVIDRGPGIPREEREAVFTLFHRARDADKRAAGTGLGLAICRGLIEALGGTIQLGDGPGGRGLCAEIRMPLASEARRRSA